MSDLEKMKLRINFYIEQYGYSGKAIVGGSCAFGLVEISEELNVELTLELERELQFIYM